MGELRDYQTKGIELIRGEFSQGIRKVLCVAPTGAGKTVMFCYMIREALSRNLKVVMVVRGRKLVDQASQRLFREGVPHGVTMANHWNYKPHLPTQICSIDTIIRRGNYPDADLLIIDEAHLANGAGYKKFLEHYSAKDIYQVGFTATPYVDTGLRHVADTMVRPVSMIELIAKGHLVNFRYFAPSEPDLRGIKIDYKTKDFNNAELETRTISGQLTGKIIDHWANKGENRPTLFFGVNVRHSMMIAERFRAAGIAAEHCDAETPERERDAILRRHKRGETKLVCNVGIFCTGVDLPYLGAIVSGRATQSYNLYVQQAGRGTRPDEETGKRDCLYFDHAGNIKRHGLPTTEPEVNLDGKFTETTGSGLRTCDECFAIYDKRLPECPECHLVPVVKTRAGKSVDLSESSEELSELEISEVQGKLNELELKRVAEGYKWGWQYWELIKVFGHENCKHLLPKSFQKRMDLKEKNMELDPFYGAPFGFKK